MNIVNLFRRKPPDDVLDTATLPTSAARHVPFLVESFGLSDRGQLRRSNEDCFVTAGVICSPPESCNN